ncbi:MAG: 30S ribosomal protein S6 [Candidatus Vogelbacteria bacterium]|nr:30S ribosomal protein S6 [Candidatus Vogelbacteria bacterium]
MKEQVIADIDLKDPKTYEIGYLLSPLVPEADKADKITEIIVKEVEAVGGTMVSQTTPHLRKLAYKIGKTINHKKTLVSDAYFGAVKFSVTPDKINTVKKQVEKSDLIIRILVIDAPVQTERIVVPRAEVKNEEVIAEEGVIEEDKGLVDNEKIDQEIEELLVA